METCSEQCEIDWKDCRLNARGFKRLKFVIGMCWLEEAYHVRSGRDLWIRKERDSTLWKITELGGTLFETENPD